ncbi:hypothetical protein [Geothrix terrae]|uniref:hypothetical protein n=1 Tax=Geothrix terrae TaxID=2922720 RepID=UPI001FAC4E02|nr:hypothetical protein [Geothrix terrae]
MQTIINTLEIGQKGKGIPYGGLGEIREDGDANYGFKYLKGNEQLLGEIPELKRDEALHRLVRAINSNHTGLFSVGCVSGIVQDERGFRYSGYVEFSWDSISMVADAQHYFQLFFHFDRYLRKLEFLTRVAFVWELMPASFIDAKANGFSCSITINTDYSETEESAVQAWSQALAALEIYLGSIPPQMPDRIPFRDA